MQTIILLALLALSLTIAADDTTDTIDEEEPPPQQLCSSAANSTEDGEEDDEDVGLPQCEVQPMSLEPTEEEEPTALSYHEEDDKYGTLTLHVDSVL